MDNMLEHPWTELQLLIKEKWLTQKAFSSILWKKVSEVNELLKWKRNITIQRDYLLHQTLWTPIKYWILKQIDYDYSLIDIDEENTNNNQDSVSMTDQDWNREQNENIVEPELNWTDINNNPGSASMTDQNWNREQNENVVEPGLNWTEDTQDSSVASLPQNDTNMSSRATAKDLKWKTEELNTQDSSSSLHSSSEWQEENKDDEDFKKRARIFKSF